MTHPRSAGQGKSSSAGGSDSGLGRSSDLLAVSCIVSIPISETAGELAMGDNDAVNDRIWCIATLFSIR